MAQLDDANIVKVVTAQNGDALYFSRLPIPFERDAGTTTSTRYLRHLGVYAYAADWLLKMAQLPPTPLEQTEKLEQLRALENGVHLRVLEVDDVVNIAIDTLQDLADAEAYLGSKKATELHGNTRKE
jgi:3-deoxy-manno-octulosonate cytidylyltransferase (CMP-KDO synthetase)